MELGIAGALTSTTCRVRSVTGSDDNVLCLNCGGRACACQRRFRLERMMEPGWAQPLAILWLAWAVVFMGLGAFLWWACTK